MESLRDAESRAAALLAACGFGVSARTSASLRVLAGGETFDVLVKVRRSATYEWDALRLLESTNENILLAVPRASASVIALAESEPRLSVVSLDAGVVVWRGDRLAPTESEPRAASMHASFRRKPWGRWALMRILALASEALPQTILAGEVGISQPAVSQALSRLGASVERTSGGWRARDRSLMWDAFLSEYPGPGGITSYWYGLESVNQQAADAIESARTSSIDALLSGDSAVDLLSPWRIPVRGVVYARSALDLRRHAFAESAPERATMEVVVPADSSLWATASSWPPKETVDPLIAAWDLLHSGGPDARESAERLKDRVLRSDDPDRMAQHARTRSAT